jgi:hypothetical protein
MIKIGVLGCADIARRQVIPNMIKTGLFEVVAVASRTEQKAVEFADAFGCEAIVGYEELLKRNDIEAVYVPLPTGMHYEWIMKALRAGKHVFSEKSLASDLSEVEDILALAKRNSLCVFENFMFLFHSQFDAIRKMLDDGEIGDLRLLRSSFGFPPFSADSNIRYKNELGGGALLDAGAYTIMAAHFLLGRDQEVIASSLENFGHGVDFQGAAMLKNSAGIVSQLAFGFDNFYQNNIELWGSKGKLFVERAFTAGPGFMPRVIVEKQNLRTEIILPADNHFEKILIKFHDCIKQGRVDDLTGQLLTQSRLLTAVRQMAKTSIG